MLALPCCRRGGSVDWGGDAAGGAPATGLVGGERGSPAAAPPMARGEGGRARIMSTTVLAALGGGSSWRPRGGASAAAARGCSGPQRCGRTRRVATPGVALLGRGGGAAGWGRPVAARARPRPPLRLGRRGGTVPVLRPPPLAATRGAPQAPPHSAELPRPPRGGERWGGRYRIGPPPLVAGVIGGPRPPHPTPGATSPRGHPD